MLESLRTTAGSVGPGILTAGTTTALAFYAAMLADFQAVAELGWIAGSGVLLCAFSCFIVMPPLLRLVDRRDRRASPPPRPSPLGGRVGVGGMTRTASGCRAWPHGRDWSSA